MLHLNYRLFWSFINWQRLLSCNLISFPKIFLFSWKIILSVSFSLSNWEIILVHWFSLMEHIDVPFATDFNGTKAREAFRGRFTWKIPGLSQICIFHFRSIELCFVFSLFVMGKDFLMRNEKTRPRGKCNKDFAYFEGKSSNRVQANMKLSEVKKIIIIAVGLRRNTSHQRKGFSFWFFCWFPEGNRRIIKDMH